METTPANPPVEPDFEREIHYAIRSESIVWSTRKQKAETLCLPMLSSLKMVALPGALMLIYAIVEVVLSGPARGAAVVYSIIALAVIVPLFVRGRREKLENERLRPSYPGMSKKQYRLRVAGQPGKLERLRVMLASEEEEFEPRIIRAARPKRAGARDILVIGGLFVVSFATFVLMGSVFSFRLPMMGFVTVYLAMGLAFLVWSFLWPVYLRFVPGRVDVMTYGVLGKGRPSVRSIDLRAARVLVSIPGSAVVFLPGEAAPLMLAVDGGSLEFEAAILMAAKSTAPSPPLPDDDLLG